MKNRIIELLKTRTPYKEIVNLVGCSKATISYHAKKNGLGYPDIGSGIRYDWGEISKYYETHSATETRTYFGFARGAWDKAILRGDIISRRNSDRTRPLGDVMIENSTYQRANLKTRLIKEGLLKHVCVECGLKDAWNNKPLVLHLDHINGVPNDNRIENLRFLCPNCHTQTLTYAGRNKKHK